MPIPNTLILKSSDPVWDSSTGYQVESVYEGTATESELTSVWNDFIAAGALRVRTQKSPFKFDALGESSYEATVTVTWASTGQSGDPGNPADPDYGLFSRNWSLDFEDDQVALIASTRAEELMAWDTDWPMRIQLAAARYRAAWTDYLRAEVAAAGSGTMPERERDFHPIVRISGSGVAPSGIQRNTIAVWMFDRLTNDEDAVSRVKRPVLTKDEVVAPISNVRASSVDVGRIFRYNTLLSRETSLAGAVLLNLSQVSTRFPFWLKEPPHTSVTQQGRFQLSQQYIGVAAYDGIEWGPAL